VKGFDMTDIPQIEMKIHNVKDQLGSIEFKLNEICDKVEALISKMEEHEAEFAAIEEKLNG
jgi:archaellum component FlaC